MKIYLSFGGGVNSVAMYLLLESQKVDFEAIFVDHKTDYPETYEYIEMFKKRYPITILKPDLGILYNYYLKNRIIPSVVRRDCTDKFKLRPVYKYVTVPCFMMIGIDTGESKRARISNRKGVENRYPLIEENINREGCKQIIRNAGLPIPIKSGCYICPFHSKSGWIKLRKDHPDLFCKAQTLENNLIEDRKQKGLKPFTFKPGQRLINVVDEKQKKLFKEDEYPPCTCML